MKKVTLSYNFFIFIRHLILYIAQFQFLSSRSQTFPFIYKIESDFTLSVILGPFSLVILFLSIIRIGIRVSENNHG